MFWVSCCVVCCPLVVRWLLPLVVLFDDVCCLASHASLLVAFLMFVGCCLLVGDVVCVLMLFDL